MLLIKITAEDMARHVINVSGAKKIHLPEIADAFERYAEYIAELVSSGSYLTERQRDEWKRETDWSGL